ncbi:imelysin family protein [Marinirhabdus gelatinilytica]|uniref:Imelysin n=1 Tax=Marinirhabdus gelatinilytica TaxID=1703343 RepID=A0A370QEZ0_9FLAO|nr:imelysin family protein [Marinirhabdus gelatinilytica]RDK86938.1 imelysin [Marinirhabdus gelatinilytica]
MTRKILILFAFIAVAYACSESDDTGSPGTNDSFDRSLMLVHWADNIIIPSYQDFVPATVNLRTSTTIFVDEPTSTSLNDLRQKWETAYLSFQNVSMFEIGPAEMVRFRDRMNTYPTNISEISQLIANGTYDFSLPSTNDAQGFPAMDYLLNGLGDDSETLAFYTTDTNAEANRNFLADLANAIHTLSENVLADWSSSFRDDFVNNDGSSASASVDKLTNDYIFYYEKALRAGKIGIPAGVFSNDPQPQTVEAMYAEDFSKALAMESLQATERFFKGQSFNGNQVGPSYEAYLDFLNTIKNGEDLGSLINSQFTKAKTELNELDDNFVNQIETDNSKMLEAYDELQRNVILLKVDMLQALSIDVDYVDSDGD